MTARSPDCQFVPMNTRRRGRELACRERWRTGRRLDVREEAAAVPRRKGANERRGTVHFDAAVAGGFRPGESARVPLDEGFGFSRDVEVLVEAGVLLADLGVSVLDQQPVALVALPAGEVEADDDPPVRKSVSLKCVAHRPKRNEGVEVLGGDLEPGGTPLAEQLADLEQVVTCCRELVSASASAGLGCR